MSPREKAQEQIAAYLNGASDYWNAPYGVLTDLSPVGNGGKVRTVSFGIARWLDATVFVWSPTRFSFVAQGSKAPRLSGAECTSPQAVINLLEVVRKSS